MCLKETTELHTMNVRLMKCMQEPPKHILDFLPAFPDKHT